MCFLYAIRLSCFFPVSIQEIVKKSRNFRKLGKATVKVTVKLQGAVHPKIKIQSLYTPLCRGKVKALAGSLSEVGAGAQMRIRAPVDEVNV